MKQIKYKIHQIREANQNYPPQKQNRRKKKSKEFKKFKVFNLNKI